MENYMINVLLIEDNPGDARMIRELFVEAKATSVALVCADRLSQGLAMLSEGGIDIVLLDLSLTDSKGFETFVKVREKARETPVIVLTGLDDEVLAMRTVREGAQDYIVKGSVTPHALTRCIRFALERHKTRVVEPAARRRSSPGRVLGFMGAKGGVGTTTVALNAAAILAGPNKTVIALELRPLGSSLCLQLQQTPNRNLSHLMDLAVDLLPEDPIKTCLVSLPSGMSTLCAAQKTDQVREIRPEQVQALVRCTAQLADYVIVDLPSEVCGFSQTAVRACDLMTVGVQRDPN